VNAQSAAAHLVIATAASADYLLTWNCRHLANAQILRPIETRSTGSWLEAAESFALRWN
jgi:hypothetical protein